MSRWADIFNHLDAEGFDVYPPGIHKGECLAPYVVVKDNGSSPFSQYSSSQDRYDLMCYVPKDKYSTLEEFIHQVEESMKGLEPMIKPTHFKTPSFLDDLVKGFMVSIQYINYKKL